MPSLSIFGRFLRSNPWGQDDLHYLCLLLGLFRVLQLCAIIPLWAFLYMNKWTQQRAGVEPAWCVPSDTSASDASSDRMLGSLQDDGAAGGANGTGTGTGAIINSTLSLFENGTFVGDGFNEQVSEQNRSRRYLEAYTLFSFVYSVSDLALLAAIWSAASVGTPANPMGRTVWLRPLLRFKILGMNALLIALVVIGIGMVYFERLNGYGCFAGSTPTFEATAWYAFFCLLLVLQSIELGVWPCVIINKIRRYTQSTMDKSNADRKRTSRRDRWLGACFSCIGFVTCYKGGGRSLAREGGFADIVRAMMDFLHTGGKLDVVFSDIYVAFKMLVRVQRERQFEAMLDSPLVAQGGGGDLENGEIGDDALAAGSVDEEAVPKTGSTSLVLGHWSAGGDAQEVPCIKLDRERSIYVETTREALTRPEDLELLRQAHHFAEYSEVIYGGIQKFVHDNAHVSEETEANGAFMDTDENVGLDELVRDCFASTYLVYLQYRQSSINHTPYAIIVDKKIRSVVITIRGSASLEDMAVDLQLSPASFRGDQFCHSGVLARAQWIYDDIEHNKILDSMLIGDDAAYPDYNLVIGGHSLGAGCAALLSIMLHDKFPGLKCFAFCPPGGLLSHDLAVGCKDYVISFINSADIVPRLSYENMERLRDDALDVLSRIRVSKSKVLTIISKAQDDKDLAYINSLLLYGRDEVPRDTKFYHQLQEFKNAQEERKASSSATYVPLFPPGKIVYVAKRKLGYKPQWADNADFNEILLSSTLAQDHSILTVIKNLKDIIEDFGTDSKDRFDDEEEDDAEKVDILQEHSASIIETPSFVWCSRPHGNVFIVPVILGIISFVLTFLTNNTCAFVSRLSLVSDKEVGNAMIISNPGIGVSTGLWSFQQKMYSGSGPKDDPSSYNATNLCLPYPSFVEPDQYLTTARICGTLAALLGGFTIVFMAFASCVRYRRIPWGAITAALFLTVLFEGLVFLFLRSDLCNTWQGTFDDGVSHKVESQCTLGWGGNMGIAAVVMWTITASATIYYPPPLSEAELAMKWLKM